MSGTHGTEDGVSALTKLETKIIDDQGRTINIDLMEHGFYQEDCSKVGIKAGPRRTKERPPLSYEEPFTEDDWEKLPDITEPAEKMTPPPPDSLGNDDLMKKMDIRVAHTTYYYKNKNKLIRDIKKVELNQIKFFILNHSLSLSRISSWWDSASV